MDRQGNRVRFTRLGIALVSLALIGWGGVFAARSWWKHITTADSGLHDSDEIGGESSKDSATDSSLTGATVETSPNHSTDSIGGSRGSTDESVQGTGEDASKISAPPHGTHPLDAVLDLAKQALVSHRQKHFDYTATLSKSERIKDKLQPTSLMAMKLRYHEMEPNASIRTADIYFKFLEPRRQAGREVIYAPLKNDGKIKAHEGGFLGLITVELTPNSQLAMSGNRYPITDAGIEKLIVKLIEKGERDRTRGDCLVERSSGHLIGDRSCELIEVIHPERTFQANDVEMEHEFFKAQIWFDLVDLIPVKYASYLWPDTPDGEATLEEEYTYTDLKLNCGLSDIDFDTENKSYSFP